MTVILTGGASRRMGRDKAMLPWRQETMLQNLITTYSALGDVAVSVNTTGRFAFHGARELVDRFPDQGPLNGIVSAFEDSGEDMIFLTATDLPFGDSTLVLRMAELMGDADACVLRRGTKGIEPLFALYRRSACFPARECLEEGRRSFFALFDRIRVRYVEEAEVSGFDLEHILLNVNTPQELEQAKRADSR